MATLMSISFKERFLTAFKKDETLNATCQEIASEIQSGHTKLGVVVEELGTFVTEKDVTVREKGILALSMILTNLPKNFLNESEVQFITSFYCDRLKDQHSVIPAVLKGILAIVQMNHMPRALSQPLCRAIFDNIRCQSHLLADRQNIYLIFITLVQNRINDLKAMGPDFVYGVINIIDGERDPRNLILLFNILPDFMREFPLGHLTEEMFEVIACYFPIDFNSPATEDLGVTRDDLAEKLAPCLCVLPEFAEFCVPLILDKLFSTLKVAKLDSLTLLCKGARTFGVKGLKQYLSELWNALKKEIIHGGDAEVKNASLKGLVSVIEILSNDAKLCENFIDDIIKDVKASLLNVQLNLFKPVVTLLKSVAMVNKESCMQVLKIVVPLCLGQYTTKTSIIDKVILMETLNIFIKVACDYRFNIKDVPELTWTDIPQLYLSELSTENTELQSKILSGFIVQKAYLNETHRQLLYNKISNLNEMGCKEVRSLCHSSIQSFATLYPNEILALIKEKFQLDDGVKESEMQIRKIEMLAAVAKIRQLGIEVLPHIISQISVASSETSFTALTCLHRLLAIKNIEYDIHHYVYNECNIIDKLRALNISPVDRRLNVIFSICRLIIRNFTLAEQQCVVNKYVLNLSEKITETDAALIMNIFIPLRRNIDFTINLNLLQNLYSLALNCNYANIRVATCEFIAVLLNKINDSNDHFQDILLYFKEKINDYLNATIDMQRKEAAASLQIWLTKAIVMKGSCDVETFLNELASVLKHGEVGQYVAQEYKILADRQENTLLEENFCTVKIFYKQRVFEHLIKKNQDFETSSRQNYLTALAQLMEEVPMELSFMLLMELAPLLIESLSLDNEQLIFTTLITLKSLLETKHVIFSDKAQWFIPKLLELSTHKRMRVRIEALECLANYWNYPVSSIRTYKQDVLEYLAATIDDRKRLVRKAAVKARTRWYLVDAPIKQLSE